MPKGKKNYTTPHVCIPLNNPRRNIPSEHDQNIRYRLQQSALDSFHAEIHGPVFLSVGPEAELDIDNNFNLDKPFHLHLDPPSSENHLIFIWTHPHLKTHYSAESVRKVRNLF